MKRFRKIERATGGTFKAPLFGQFLERNLIEPPSQAIYNVDFRNF